MSQRFKALLDVVSTVALMVTCAILVYTSLSKELITSGSARPSDPVDTVDVENDGLTLRVPASIPRDQASRRLVLVEFSDFECPFCARYARDSFVHVKRAFVDTGQAAYAVLHFPLEAIHPAALKAAEAAECARSQGKFWEMRDVLFAKQQLLAYPALVGYASELGLDVKRFVSCLAGEMQNQIRADVEQAMRLGVDSTPTIFIGTKAADSDTVTFVKVFKGAVPFSRIETAVRDVLASLN